MSRVFGFPCFKLRMKDFYNEGQIDFYEEIPMGIDPAEILGPPNYRIITADELGDLQRELRAREDILLKVKGHDYTHGGPNRLANFIADSEVLGMSPEKCWAVHFRKQVAAITTWASTGHVESESLMERFVDVRNYCLLGLALDRASRPTEEERGVV